MKREIIHLKGISTIQSTDDWSTEHIKRYYILTRGQAPNRKNGQKSQKNKSKWPRNKIHPAKVKEIQFELITWYDFIPIIWAEI